MSDLDNINSSFEQRIQSVKSKEELQSLKTEFFGKSGQITNQFKNLGTMSPEKKKNFQLF
jgi:phenylalanyl-tRNA synthetase alpha chain